jgi:hypothetical protein
MAPTSRAEIEEIKATLSEMQNKQTDMDARLQIVEKESGYNYKLLVVGNGDAPLKELGRQIADWMKQNKDIPELVRSHEKWFQKNENLINTVDRQGRWIENVNWIARAILLVLIGILATNVWNIATHPPPIP